MNNIKFGKSMKSFVRIKQNYLEENDSGIAFNNRIRDLYTKQEVRKRCKLCSRILEIGGVEKVYIESRGIRYYKCPKCGHINGEYEETIDFCNKMYNLSSYDATYLDKDKVKYRERIKNIYLPKADFLNETLLGCEDRQTNSKENVPYSVLDIGCGAGHFVAALRQRGFFCSGVDVSERMVKYGNQMNEYNLLKAIKVTELSDIVMNTTANIISAIGVLVHLNNLSDILHSIKSNKNIEYLYICIPLLSYSDYIECANQAMFNRHLGGGHTNIFTRESTDYLLKNIGFNIVGEWNFGADAMDLFRSISVGLRLNNNQQMQEDFAEKYLEIIDDIQLLFDKQKMCSELHLIMKRSNQ